MKQALKEVKYGKLGYLAASKEYDVPKFTLERRVKYKNERATVSTKGLGNFKTVFPKQLEQELVNYILRMEDIFDRLKRLMLGCSLSNWHKEILLNIRFTVKLEKLKKIG